MPYKDKAKKAQWEREHRGAGTQRAIWWGYLYFDSAPDDWETRIRESGYAPSKSEESGEVKIGAKSSL